MANELTIAELVSEKIAKVRKAQEQFATFTQEQVDQIGRASCRERV